MKFVKIADREVGMQAEQEKKTSEEGYCRSSYSQILRIEEELENLKAVKTIEF